MPSHKTLILFAVASAMMFVFLASASPAFAASSEQTLYNFCNQGDNCAGYFPSSGLTFDTAGNLYGTTEEGGTDGEGTVFELILNGGVWTEQTLYNFCSAANCADGDTPYGGGVYSKGSVFELIPNNGKWTENVLFSFNDGPDAPFWPDSVLVLDTSGNLYGTTSAGGTYNDGTVFEVTP
jgi:uncharacterized repeat protein (TIGR03803 family)